MTTITLRGIDDERRRSTSHHDLDYLAGTWSEAEAEAFSHATVAFEKVDENLWK